MSDQTVGILCAAFGLTCAVVGFFSLIDAAAGTARELWRWWRERRRG